MRVVDAAQLHNQPLCSFCLVGGAGRRTREALVAAWCYVQGTSGYLRMEQEDGLVASVRAMLEAELGKEPSPRAGSGAARRIDELRAMEPRRIRHSLLPANEPIFPSTLGG